MLLKRELKFKPEIWEEVLPPVPLKVLRVYLLRLPDQKQLVKSLEVAAARRFQEVRQEPIWKAGRVLNPPVAKVLALQVARVLVLPERGTRLLLQEP